ncbi:hypothetical protein REPUB_Repub12eG0162600 [Reevesia pubescens]
MSNQPAPTRPWFRLSSMARPAAPQGPSPTPQPTPAPRAATSVRPAFRPAVQAQPPPPAAGVSSVPTSPVAVSRASQPSSPVTATAAGPTTSPPKTAITASVPSSPAKTAPTTTVKPAIQSPIQSPRIKPPTAPPPSPLTLSPPQLKTKAELEPKIPVEAEQKTVLVQKTIDKPKGWLFGSPQPQKDLGDTHKPNIGQKEPSKNGETKEKGHGKKFSSDSEDAGMRVITIAGENKGAFMELIQSPHKNGFQGSPHLLQKKVNTSRTGSDGSDHKSYSSSEEDNRKMKDKSNTSKTMPMNAFMNSNVQSVNNSIVYNSSCTQHDPGVHLSLRREPTGGGFHVKERTNGYSS